MSESKASRRKAAAVLKQQQALELRKAGYTFEVIADRLGYAGPAGSYKAVTTALRNTIQQPADEVRRLELERLDRMQAGLWNEAIKGRWLAVDRVLKIMERRASLLGLDAPAQMDITIIVRELALAEGMSPEEADAAVMEAERILQGARGSR